MKSMSLCENVAGTGCAPELLAGEDLQGRVKTSERIAFHKECVSGNESETGRLNEEEGVLKQTPPNGEWVKAKVFQMENVWKQWPSFWP